MEQLAFRYLRSEALDRHAQGEYLPFLTAIRDRGRLDAHGFTSESNRKDKMCYGFSCMPKAQNCSATHDMGLSPDSVVTDP